jgi:hypothetical protein
MKQLVREIENARGRLSRYLHPQEWADGDGPLWTSNMIAVPDDPAIAVTEYAVSSGMDRISRAVADKVSAEVPYRLVHGTAKLYRVEADEEVHRRIAQTHGHEGPYQFFVVECPLRMEVIEGQC